ncbi:MAG: DsrE family protein [Betaproteobacteria bacterium]|nr:DsrE family protein [Betaproteobacteria bacterium]MDH4323782.1 DsrE family protein [Betaproteobacteria bacterium]MDH5212099.1 DsrE family protein [Betaproteobacteria bacterium]MDH5579484.1 DsrE family protein [Betaproteobacteria bacterium]
MNCPDAVRLMNAYVDEELDAASVLALEAHLRGCARCRARADSLHALRSGVQRHTEFRMAPTSLRDKVQARLGHLESVPAGATRRRVAMGAAALAVVALAAWTLRGTLEPAPANVARGTGKVVYHVSSSQNAGAALRTLRNHLEASPETKVVVVAHNEGVDFLLRGARDESGQLFATAVRQFKDRGVDFRVCNNTLVRRRIDGGGILPEATLVPSGIAEISRLQEREGYTYMRM